MMTLPVNANVGFVSHDNVKYSAYYDKNKNGRFDLGEEDVSKANQNGDQKISGDELKLLKFQDQSASPSQSRPKDKSAAELSILKIDLQDAMGLQVPMSDSGKRISATGSGYRIVLNNGDQQSVISKGSYTEESPEKKTTTFGNAKEADEHSFFSTTIPYHASPSSTRREVFELKAEENKDPGSNSSFIEKTIVTTKERFNTWFERLAQAAGKDVGNYQTISMTDLDSRIQKGQEKGFTTGRANYLKDHFGEIDKNGNGKLSAAEIEEANLSPTEKLFRFVDLPTKTIELAQKKFDKWYSDTKAAATEDNSTKTANAAGITKKDLRTALNQKDAVSNPLEMSLLVNFSDVDKDGNGNLSQIEIGKATIDEHSYLVSTSVGSAEKPPTAEVPKPSAEKPPATFEEAFQVARDAVTKDDSTQTANAEGVTKADLEALKQNKPDFFPTQRRALQDYFSVADKDNSGGLSRSEILLQLNTPTEIDKAFEVARNAVTNDNSTQTANAEGVTQKDLEALRRDKPDFYPQQTLLLQTYFTDADKDKSGGLSSGEIIQQLEKTA